MATSPSSQPNDARVPAARTPAAGAPPTSKTSGVRPILVPEDEFQKLSAGLVEDPVSEWLWKVTSAGPIVPDVYED